LHWWSELVEGRGVFAPANVASNADTAAGAVRPTARFWHCAHGISHSIPHRYATSLSVDLARGEAYAPDDAAALSQLAHGVGTAIDSLSLRKSDSEITSLLQAIANGQDPLSTS
jgi:hypothetical protein